MDANSDGMISRSELAALLHNIGAEHQLTDNDLDDIMNELGEQGSDSKKREIHIEHVEDLILGRGH